MSDRNGVGAFDFFIGSWDSKQRRLVKPLADCDEWLESTATSRAWRVFDGAAHVDEVRFPEWGFNGLSIRLHNPETGEWSIYWVNSRTGELTLPPVVGHFTDGVGQFYSDEQYEGRDIKVRYTWSDITPTSLRWEQAFSPDAGKTWELNWIAEFTKSD